MTLAPLRTLLHRIDWHDLRDLWGSPPIRFLLHGMALLLVGGIGLHVLPDPFNDLLRLYMTWMLLSLALGMLLMVHRWWLVWLVGTHALCISHLMTLTTGMWEV